MPHLIVPDRRFQAAYVEALKEGLDSMPASPEDLALVGLDFDAWLKKISDVTRPVTLPDGRQVARMPQYDFWLVDGDRFIGRTALRPTLNDVLLQRGGHIGYAIRASERRKGYGHLILKLALAQLRKDFGHTRALVTCSDQNQGSIQIIEGAGGVLENKITIPGLDMPERRYWIEIS